MYTQDELRKMIFIDIETSTQKETLQELINENPALEEYWNIKTTQLIEDQPETLKDFADPHKMWSRMAGLYPEWGKIVCISMGQLQLTRLVTLMILKRSLIMVTMKNSYYKIFYRPRPRSPKSILI